MWTSLSGRSMSPIPSLSIKRFNSLYLKDFILSTEFLVNSNSFHFKNSPKSSGLHKYRWETCCYPHICLNIEHFTFFSYLGVFSISSTQGLWVAQICVFITFIDTIFQANNVIIYIMLKCTMYKYTKYKHSNSEICFPCFWLPAFLLCCLLMDLLCLSYLQFIEVYKIYMVQ